MILCENVSRSSGGTTSHGSGMKRDAPAPAKLITGNPQDMASNMLRPIASQREVQAKTSAARYQGHGSAWGPGNETTSSSLTAAMSFEITLREIESASPPIHRNTKGRAASLHK